MKKTLVIYLANLNGGGAERLHINIAPEFVKRGFDVTFLVHSREGSLANAVPAAVRLVSLECGRTLSALLPLARFLKKEKPDILVSNLGHNNIIAIWAGMLAKSVTKIIATQHNSLSSESANGSSIRYRILPFMYKLFLGKASGIVAVSRGVADDMATLCGIKREKITIIYNPIINHDFYSRMEEAVSHPWLQEKHDVPVLLGVGRFTEQKDFATLLHAVALASKTRNIRLILLGEGQLQEKLQQLIKTLGIGERVDMLGFQLNPLSFMKHADLLVMSSRYEGFGNVLVEALACGTSVVSTDCPSGPAEILENGKYGLLTPVGDPQALAAAIIQTLDKPLPAQTTMERGRQFTVERTANEYIALFNS